MDGEKRIEVVRCRSLIFIELDLSVPSVCHVPLLKMEPTSDLPTLLNDFRLIPLSLKPENERFTG